MFPLSKGIYDTINVIFNDLVGIKRSMLIRATLFNRSWPMVFRKYVFILRKPLNERSTVQVVAGIIANDDFVEFWQHLN